MLNNQFNHLPKLIIFDWDNTIIENWNITYEAMNYLLKKFGKEPWDMEQIKNNTNFSRRESFPAIFGIENADKASELYIEKYRSFRSNNLSYIKDAKIFLDFLFEKRDKNLTKLAILSNKAGEDLRLELKTLKIYENFDIIIGAGDFSEDKPSIMGVDNIKEKLGIKNDEIIWFIGDSVIDMECAVKSGCIAILFGEKKPYDECFLSYKPDYYFENYRDFYFSIKNL